MDPKIVRPWERTRLTTTMMNMKNRMRRVMQKNLHTRLHEILVFLVSDNPAINCILIQLRRHLDDGHAKL